jgi:hypothetical protein
VPKGCRAALVVLMWNSCCLMHRILIRLSRSGTAASIRIWPIISLTILANLKRKFINPLIICVPNNRYCGPFSKRLNSNYNAFH